MGGLPAEGWPGAVSVPILVLVLVGAGFWLVLVDGGFWLVLVGGGFLVLVGGGSESNVVGDRGA